MEVARAEHALRLERASSIRHGDASRPSHGALPHDRASALLLANATTPHHPSSGRRSTLAGAGPASESSGSPRRRRIVGAVSAAARRVVVRIRGDPTAVPAVRDRVRALIAYRSRPRRFAGRHVGRLICVRSSRGPAALEGLATHASSHSAPRAHRAGRRWRPFARDSSAMPEYRRLRPGMQPCSTWWV